MCRLIRDVDNKPYAADYPYDQDIWRKARFMLGYTNDAAATFEHDFVNLVVAKKRPLAWHDPWDTNGGFRVLLPHTRAGSDAMYVTAVRADVRH